MNNLVKTDMGWSSVLFRDQVWPLCKKILGGGDLLQMEGRTDSELATLFDMHSGIDGWQINQCGMRGIASRIQVGDYRTFTVRMSRDSGGKTEYAKRLEAIKGNGGWLYPKITVQAYCASKNDGPIVSLGIAKTEDIIQFIERGLHATNRTTNASFAVCAWNRMVAAGYRVWTYYKPGLSRTTSGVRP